MSYPVDRDQIAFRVRTGALERLSPRVFRIGGAPQTRRQLALAAVFDAEDRPIGYQAPESHLEARVRDILEGAGLHGFDRQVDVGDDDGWIGRVDFLHRPSGFILMTDGDRWHRQLVDRLADAAQHRRLAAAGFRLDRVTETQVWMRPHSVAELARRYLLAA